MKKNKLTNNRGFTLIELLIVIVIIGILSGILIAVINPVRQQNRARNGSIRSTMSKVAFSINSARSALGKLPEETQIEAELENSDADATNCSGSAGTLSCSFTVSGTSLPLACNSQGIPDSTGSTQCVFSIFSPDTSGGTYRLFAESYAINSGSQTMFVFDSSQGLFECNLEGGTTITAAELYAFTSNAFTIATMPSTGANPACVALN